jgi:hypothetical protein
MDVKAVCSAAKAQARRVRGKADARMRSNGDSVVSARASRPTVETRREDETHLCGEPTARKRRLM